MILSKKYQINNLKIYINTKNTAYQVNMPSRLIILVKFVKACFLALTYQQDLARACAWCLRTWNPLT